MNEITLYDAELKLMDIIWQEGIKTAKELSLIATEQIGWNKNTTYTMLKKLVAKGAIKRSEPNFVCEPLISKEDAQLIEANKLVSKLFKGSAKMLISSFIEQDRLSDAELLELRRLIDEKM